MSPDADLPATPAAHGGPFGKALLRAGFEDFRVTEIMNVVPEGEGEHLWLEIEKTDWNTEDVALWLAKQAGIHRLAVGYSGLKDRRAVTRQWFSLHLPGKADPDFPWPAGLVALQARRHRIGYRPKMFPMPEFESTDIDTEFDFSVAEAMATKMNISNDDVQYLLADAIGAGSLPGGRKIKVTEIHRRLARSSHMYIPDACCVIRCSACLTLPPDRMLL